MKLLAGKLAATDFLMINKAKLLNEDACARKYQLLLEHFILLQNIHNALDKLGHLALVGITQTERTLFKKFKIIKELINKYTVAAIDREFADLEKLLSEFQNWLEQNNSFLSASEFRLAMKNCNLQPTELLALARFFINQLTISKENIAKLELTIAKLLTVSGPAERGDQFTTLFPLASPLTIESQAAINEIHSIAERLEAITELPILIESGYLEKARELKNSLGAMLKHPLVIISICKLNSEFKIRFQNLFNIEGQYIAATCKRLIENGIATIDDVEDGNRLDLEEVSKFIERLEELLEGDYHQNLSTLKQLAAIGRAMRQANELLDQNIVIQTSAPPAMASAELSPDLDPIIISSKRVSIGDIREQLNARLSEIERYLRREKDLNRDKIAVQLKYSLLPLDPIEAEFISSSGDLLESNLFIKTHELIRQAIALIAEMQESVAIFSENSAKKISKYYFSLATMAYLLMKNQEIRQEIFAACNFARQINNYPLILTTNSLHEQLAQLYNKNLQILTHLFPMIKPQHLSLFGLNAKANLFQ